MLNLQLYIYDSDNEKYNQIELFDDESITITQSLQDVKDIQKIFTDYSRTFSIPASKTNNKIFKHYYNYHISDFDAQKRIEAKIYINHEHYKDGYIKLEGSTMLDNKAHTYKLTFFGSGVVLKDVLKDDKIGGLALLQEEFEFDYNSNNILDYLQNGYDVAYNKTTENSPSVERVTISDAIIVPLISHTKRLVYDTNSLDNRDTVNNLHNDTDKGLELSQLKPAIKVDAIVRAIQQQYPQLEFTDDFFNEENTPYSNLYMWLHKKSGFLYDEQVEQVPLKDFNVTASYGSGKSSGVVSVYSSSIKNPISGQGNILGYITRNMNVTITPPDNNEYAFVIYNGGKQYARYNFTGEHTETIPYLPQGILTFHIEGGSIGIYNATIKIYRRTLSNIGGDRYVKFNATANFGTDTKLNASANLPDMKILDFLTGLFKMFNLTAFVNKDGKVAVQSLDQFYRSSGKIYDVTEYLDKNTSSVQSTLPYSKIEFKYTGQDSFLAKNHKDQFNKEWGTADTNEENIASDLSTKDNVGEEYTVEVPFEHFKYEKILDNDTKSDTGVMYGWSVDEKQEPYIGKPLMFYGLSQPTSVDVKYINLDDTTGILSSGTNIYMPSNSLAVGVSDTTNINFSAEQNEYDLVPYENTLFNKYYKNYIIEVFDKQRRITNTQAFLPLSVLSSINLNDIIKISDNIYKINTLTTDFQTMVSKLELVNTQNTIGQLVTTDLKFSQSQLGGLCATTDSHEVRASNVAIKADCKSYEDGYISDNSDAFDADSNTPDTADEDGHPVVVTQATLLDPHITTDNGTVRADTHDYKADANQRTVTSSSWRMGYQITELGLIGESPNLDEYGFLYSTTESELVGTDVDDIAAIAGVTQIAYETPSNFKRPSVPYNASYQETNAASTTTYYVRFYARTNTSLNYAEADAISEIETITTL